MKEMSAVYSMRVFSIFTAKPFLPMDHPKSAEKY